MLDVAQIVGPTPAWLDLGPATLVDGLMVREVLNDFSDRDECDRPLKYVVEASVTPGRPRVPFDRSDTRADIPQSYPGEDIRQLKGRHSGPCAIFFNGWSLANHDLHRVKVPIIGINRTHVGFPGYDGPEPDYLCAIDIEWITNPRVRRHPGLVNGSTDKDHVGYRATRCFRMSPFSPDLGRDGFPPFVPGTTGFLALHLAVYLGFTRIYCLGLDLTGGHFDRTKGSVHFIQMRQHFERMAPHILKHAEVFVVGNEHSKAPFPHMTFEEFLACQR